MAVIHIGWHNHLPSKAVFPDIDTWFTPHLPEANPLHDFTEFKVPLPSALLEAIKCLQEQAIQELTIL
jgi:hypothetical protein